MLWSTGTVQLVIPIYFQFVSLSSVIPQILLCRSEDVGIEPRTVAIFYIRAANHCATSLEQINSCATNIIFNSVRLFTYFPINWQTSISFLPCAQTRRSYSQMSGLNAEYGLFYFGSVCCVDHGSCTGTKVYSLKSGLEAEYNVFYFGYSRGTAVCV